MFVALVGPILLERKMKYQYNLSIFPHRNKKFYIKPDKPHAEDTITIYAKIANIGSVAINGYPLAGYNFKVTRNTFPGIPLGDVKVEYELANLEYARIQYLDFKKNKYITFKNHAYNNLMGKSEKGSFTHKPSYGYFPARYRLIFKAPKFNNGQKMDVVVR